MLAPYSALDIWPCAMHKLRLRAKSSSSSGGKGSEDGSDSKEDSGKKKKLRAGAATNAGQGLARKVSKRGQQQQPRLLLEDNSFRTSLILVSNQRIELALSGLKGVPLAATSNEKVRPASS